MTHPTALPLDLAAPLRRLINPAIPICRLAAPLMPPRPRPPGGGQMET